MKIRKAMKATDQEAMKIRRRTDQEAVGEAGEPQKTKKANGIHHGMVSIRAS